MYGKIIDTKLLISIIIPEICIVMHVNAIIESACQIL